MKRKFTSVYALSVLLFFLAAVSSPAGEVEERIKALEDVQRANAEELERLKGQQMDFKKEATAAAAAMPNFTYRPGAGLSIQAADRGWEFRVRMPVNINMNFFPGNSRDAEDDNKSTVSGTAGCCAQGSLNWRRIRPTLDWYWEDRFYHLQLSQQWDADPPAALNMYMDVDFAKWNPYLPTLGIGRKGNQYNPVGANYAFADTTLERPFFENDFFATTSQMGISLDWTDVPLLGLPGFIGTAFIKYGMGRDVGGASDIDSDDSKALLAGLHLAPFKAVKNKWIEGITFGLGYYNDKANRDTDGEVPTNGSRSFRIRTLNNGNRTDLFRPQVRGRREVWTPHVQWIVGPYRIGGSYDRAKAERDFAGGGFINGKLDDATINTWVIRNRLWIWSPKGFLTGDDSAGGWNLNYTFNRFDADAGRDFAVRNSFAAFRRQSANLNTFALQWRQAVNMAWTIQYDLYDIAKMAGTGTAAASRTRLGLNSSGGTFQQITLDAAWRF